MPRVTPEEIAGFEQSRDIVLPMDVKFFLTDRDGWEIPEMEALDGWENFTEVTTIESSCKLHYKEPLSLTHKPK